MRNLMQWLLAVVFITIGGMIFGASGLALGGVATGLLADSSRRGFLIGSFSAAFFWLMVASGKVISGQSPQLLMLAGSLANLRGTTAWLLVVAALVIAFFAGGLGGWLGGSLRQMLNTPVSRRSA